MAKKLLISLILVLSIARGTIANSDNTSFNRLNYLLKYPEIYQQYPEEVIAVKNRIVALKETKQYENKLEYKSEEDLLETLQYTWAYTYGDKEFPFSKVTAIEIKESKLNHLAKNPVDGGKGLMQVMKKYWKEELPWYNNPYDKKQSICAGVSVLHLLKAEKKRSTWEAIRRYNGTCAKTYKYRDDVKKIHKDLQKDIRRA